MLDSFFVFYLHAFIDLLCLFICIRPIMQHLKLNLAYSYYTNNNSNNIIIIIIVVDVVVVITTQSSSGIFFFSRKTRIDNKDRKKGNRELISAWPCFTFLFHVSTFIFPSSCGAPMGVDNNQPHVQRDTGSCAQSH